MATAHDRTSVLASFLEPVEGDRCLDLTSGLAAFDSRRWLIRGAKRSIWISSFLWRNDRLGNFFIDELAARAAQGIEVRILLDHWGVSQSQDSILYRLRKLVDSGRLQVRLFNPIVETFPSQEWDVAWSGIRNGARLNHRMHGKLAIFDEAAVIVGGRNVGDEYFDLHRFRCFSDAELLVQGASATRLCECFEKFWDTRIAVDLAELEMADPPDSADEPKHASADEWEQFLEIADRYCPNYTEQVFALEAVDVFYDLPAVDQQDPTATADAMLDFWTRAKRSLRITSPILIFVPEWLNSLRRLGQRHPGLELSLVTNSLTSSDNLYTYATGLKQRRQLLGDLRARLHEIRAVPRDIDQIISSYPALQEQNTQLDEQPESGFGSNQFECQELHTTLHAKYAVADDQWLLLGSPNLDPRSLLCNTEILLIVRGRQIAELFSSHHDRFRLNRNSWVVAKASRWSKPRWIVRIQLAWYRLTGWGRSPYRVSQCFQPREETPDEIPDPYADDFQDHYRSCGVYPGVPDSEKEIEMRLLASLSTLFRRYL